MYTFTQVCLSCKSLVYLYTCIYVRYIAYNLQIFKWSNNRYIKRHTDMYEMLHWMTRLQMFACLSWFLSPILIRNQMFASTSTKCWYELTFQQAVTRFNAINVTYLQAELLLFMASHGVNVHKTMLTTDFQGHIVKQMYYVIGENFYT